MSKVIGLIPARGGSKGVHRKNVRLLHGKPLIAYAIQSAQQSQYITELYVTTDDEEIAEIAKLYGASVIDRPPELASDSARMIDVMNHALNYVCPKAAAEDMFCLMQATCPFRTVGEVDDSIMTLKQSGADAVIGVTKAVHEHPERFYQIEKGYLKSLMPEYAGRNRQDLPQYYLRNGIIYTQLIQSFLRDQTFSPSKSVALEIPAQHAINIDEEQDFLHAEFVMSRQSVSV